MACEEWGIAEQILDIVELSCSSLGFVGNWVKYSTDSSCCCHRPEPENIVSVIVEIRDYFLSSSDDASIDQTSSVFLAQSVTKQNQKDSHSPLLVRRAVGK